ncbi:hypothetical protein CCM_03618 [Cordyceps militaris CM01]|uniref:Metalloprotease m41 ftsh n=1 Tax=Cordyceps militaris (strain CM01) TaxID=983644 RepID=G3JBX5_CORMM|nr:uncharacterized protein CCM_03618 [Cordyceps militaris CM01]EGX95346.1 hypothetical protein CCM_03618 [Cordyceps militaris CM01]
MSDEIRQLKRALEEQTHRADKEKRRADEEKRRADEEKRLREQAEQNTAAMKAALLREQEERTRTTLDQPLEDYLKRVHRLNYHMPRLLPPLKKTITTLSEGHPSKSTTQGRTDIKNKYYPLHMREWTDFPDLCQQQFHRIRSELGTRPLFPSAAEVNFCEKSLLEEIPSSFVESEAFLSASRSSLFLHETLERPVQRIINAYLNTSGNKPPLYFDCHSAGWQARNGGDTSVSARTAEDCTGQNSGPAEPKISQRPKKIQPDCLVLRPEMVSTGASLVAPFDRYSDNDGKAATRDVIRVTVGEHKAFHRLRAAIVSRFLKDTMADDFMVRLARKASSKQVVPGVTSQNTTNPAESTPSTNIPGRIFFAYALAQTFHYMVISGLEFGYMAAGESLSFLRIPRDDPTTLLYYTQVFPQYCCAAGPSSDEPSTVSDDAAFNVDELAIAKLCALALLAYESPKAPPRQINIHLSQLAEFPNLPKPPSDDSAALSPTSPPSRDSSSERRRRRRDETGDDDDDDDVDDSDRRGRSMTHRPRNPSPLKKQSSTPGQQPSNADADANAAASHARFANGSQPGRGRCLPSRPSPFDPASFKPMRPYCTHLCLRSLAQGDGIVDHDCPNVLLHLEAARRIGGPAADRARHPIGPSKLVELVQLQLLNNVEQDCECLLSHGLNGAIGCLFRLTVTGFGYTLAAKGVQTFHAHRIRHEAAVYKKLAVQQGILIPVCIGVVELRLPYPMTNSKLITHMLLLSHAGTPLYSPTLRRRLEARQVDVDAEASRTLEELQALGVEDDDDTSNGNLTWCASAGRVMKIDFDHGVMSIGKRDSSKSNGI